MGRKQGQPVPKASQQYIPPIHTPKLPKKSQGYVRYKQYGLVGRSHKDCQLDCWFLVLENYQHKHEQDSV